MCAPKSIRFEPFWSENGYRFDHSPGMVFKGTTRACKRIENGMIWSEIGSGLKEPGGTPPPRIPRSTPPRKELLLSNISFDTYARINEIKTRRIVKWLC